MKKSLLSFSILLMGSAYAVSPPQNTLDLTGTIRSPLVPMGVSSNNTLNYIPQEYQSRVVPSIPTQIQGSVQNYAQSQLSPNQYNVLKSAELDSQTANMTPYLTLPSPITRTLAPDLSAGSTPPVIRVAKNFLTHLVFTDLNGNAWKIANVVMNRGQFSDQPTPIDDNAPKNILVVEPTQAIDFGNISVFLEGKATPIIFMVAGGQPEVDSRVDIKIQGRNPSVSQSVIDPYSLSAGAIDDATLLFLDGRIPDDSEPLDVGDLGGQAWYYGNNTYVKTRLDVLYPAYLSKASDSEGKTVYKFAGTLKSLTLMQRNGQPVSDILKPMPVNAIIEQLGDKQW